MRTTSAWKSGQAHRHRGFTLMESALVTVIIGTGVVALIQLLAAGSMASRVSQDTTTAVHLADQIHELALGLKFSDTVTPAAWGPRQGETLASYDDVTDLDGSSFSPPIDARRQAMSGLKDWIQKVAVESVDPNRLGVSVPKGSTRAQRLTVMILHHNQPVWSQTWLTFDTNP